MMHEERVIQFKPAKSKTSANPNNKLDMSLYGDSHCPWPCQGPRLVETHRSVHSRGAGQAQCSLDSFFLLGGGGEENKCCFSESYDCFSNVSNN